MKNHIQRTFWILTTGFLTIPISLFAQLPGENDPTGIGNPLGNTDSLPTLVRALVEGARDLGFIVAVLFLVYAGFLFVTARGDTEQLKRARMAFFWAVIGTAVLLGAWVLANVLQGTVEQL